MFNIYGCKDKRFMLMLQYLKMGVMQNTYK